MRILIVDDEPAMHDSYRRTFVARSGKAESELSAMAADLFGDEEGAVAAPDAETAFDCVHKMQGLDAVEAIKASIESGERFAVAFIDIRMPPGIDGKETATRIRKLDPDINIVIVTGFSDFSPLEITKAAGPADKIFYIAKPFEVEEVLQTATALAGRWTVDLELAAARKVLAEQVVQLEQQGLELAANESRAIHMATHDSLTEAPNRAAFLRTLAEHARGGHCFATGMLDLDRFKLVNDTLGHLAGDEMIRMVCNILQASIPEGGFVARLGGDEFGLIFACTGEDEALMVCEKFIRQCSISFDILGNSVQGGASIGLVVTPPNPLRDPVHILRRADLALNESKRGGRGQVRLFDDSMDESIRLRSRIENGLGESIANGELRLVYQPIVSSSDFEVIGFEALLRWTSPEYGPISPALFIPIAEESNLIHDLGDWVLDVALETLKSWPGQYMSVNFSPRQFRRHNFVGYVTERVQRAGIEPSRLQIEITETAIFDNVERAAETLYRLRQMGFRIALDDFGTGYSSLTNIRKFALDSLKIDRSFVDGMGRERESAAIVHSIIHLGRALGLGVIAEGVETDAQVQALRLAGASHLQGYYFAKPLEVGDAKMLADMRFMVEEADEVAADEASWASQGNGTQG